MRGTVKLNFLQRRRIKSEVRGVNKHRMSRALVVVGAGASVEYGIPGTAGLGDMIDDVVRKDGYCRDTGGTEAYFEIKDVLCNYYSAAAEAHFERVYHVLHELSELRVLPGAVSRFRPVMFPFINLAKKYSEQSLRAAAQLMLRTIYTRVSSACDSPKFPLAPLTSFLSSLELRCVPRVYTTNYDDFFEQAVADRYFTGFTKSIGNCRHFDPAAYWTNWEQPGCFHLHGSVHMGFPPPSTSDVDIGDIGWFALRSEALRYANFIGSSVERMDGTRIVRSPIITGLDKLGSLQQSPFATYYAGLAKEAVEVDVIIVLGSSLADLHLNTWLRVARRHNPKLPLLYVGYWPGDTIDLFSNFHFENGELEISLFHELRVDLTNLRESAFKAVGGWTVDAHGTAAIWTDGFQSFLNQPVALARVLTQLGVP